MRTMQMKGSHRYRNRLSLVRSVSVFFAVLFDETDLFVFPAMVWFVLTKYQKTASLSKTCVRFARFFRFVQFIRFIRFIGFFQFLQLKITEQII